VLVAHSVYKKQVRVMKGKQGTRTVCLGLLLVFLFLPRSHGVLFVSTGDPSVNTNAPSGSLATSGWQYEGQWGSFLGTPITTNFFLAAQHVGGSIGQALVLNGVAYHTVAFFDEPNTDLRLWQVAETFPSYAPVYTKADEVGKLCVVIGRGTDRGPAVVVNKATRGWLWGSTNNIERWGENVVTTILTNNSVGQLLSADFDRKGVPNECDLSHDDSSGALFIEDGATWKLAGIHYSVDGPFSHDGTTSTEFEAALDDVRGLYYMVTNAWTLVPTNYPVAIPTSFYSSRVSASYAWINGVVNFTLGNEVQITSPPVVTNALGTMGGIAVVKPGDTTGFAVGASSTNRNPLGYLWNFDDGGSSTDRNPSHVFTTCAAYAVSVTVTDNVSSATTGLTVAVACPMDVSSVKLQAKFNRVGADTCAVSGTLLNLAADASVANAVATLDVGDAVVAFQLNAKGKGSNKNGSLKLSFNARSASWTFAGKLKGDMQGAWENHGLTNGVGVSSQVTVPVVVLLQSDTVESFEVEPVLNYTDKSGPSGSATLPR
jgi:hypothetical protein